MDVSLSYATAGSIRLPSVNDGYSNLPDSLLVEDQGVASSFMLSSPSLDMEIALQQLSSTYDSELSEDLHSSEVLDVSGVDPFLEYINEMLMEEGMEDSTSRQQEAEPSYRSIIDSLYDIIRECSLPSASPDSTIGEGVSDFRLPQENCSVSDSSSSENTSGNKVSDEFGSCDNSGTCEQHANEFKPNLGIIHDIGVSRAVMDCLPISSEQERAEVLCANHGAAQVSARDITEHLGHLDPIIARKWLEQGMTNFETSSLVEKSVSYEDLKVKAGYAELYIGERGNSTATAKPISLKGEQKNPLRAALNGKRKVSGDIVGYVDIREVLMSCAQAVSMGDSKKTSEILHELYQVHGASANGNALQRIAHYFSEALVSRLGGLGGHLCRTSCNSPVMFLKVAKLGYEVSPYIKIGHYYANQSILKAAEGASRLHIVEYGSLFGMQWPCLINALADRKGGPPLLVITCVEHPQPGDNPVEKLEETGRRLAAYARTYNVPFQYHAIAVDRWEDINSASLHLHEKEVRVVNCMKRFHLLADGPINMASTISPRDKLLTSIHSLHPHLLLTSHLNAAVNSPFFLSRFREALYFFSNIFDMLEAVLGDNPERLFMERSCYALDIQNVVACEGAERVLRPETYKHWGMRTRKAGFKQLPIPAYIVSRSKSHVRKQFHKDFLVHDDAEGWLLLGWKGRTTMALSAWAPIPL